MPKIGTAIVEIKPVLNEEALAAITKLIEDTVAAIIDRQAAKLVEALMFQAAKPVEIKVDGQTFIQRPISLNPGLLPPPGSLT